MSLSHSQLMRYYDGELGAEEVAEVETALANDPQAQQVLDGLEQLSAFVRVHHEQAPADDGLADAIMASVAGEKPGDRSESPPPQVVRGAWRNIVPAAAAVLALAAGVALVNELSEKSDKTAPVVEQPVAPSELPVVPVPPLEEPPAERVFAETDPAVAIETVDFGAREGTIFMMQEGEGSTPVVWLMDDPAPTGSRMEPL